MVMFVLKTPAKFSMNIHSICLPRQDEEFDGLTAVAAGWGRTAAPDVSRVQSPVLKEVNLTVSNKRYEHYKMLGTELKKINGLYQDACSGDSGEYPGFLAFQTNKYWY